MVSSILIAATGLVAYFIYAYVSGIQRHIATAKKMGLPYIVARTWKFLLNQISQLTQNSCLSLQYILVAATGGFNTSDQEATITMVGKVDEVSARSVLLDL